MVNSQILIFYDRAVDLCNVYDKMSLFLTNAIPIYRALVPMTRRTVDISDQWSFGVLSTQTNENYIPEKKQCARLLIHILISVKSS